MSVEYVIDGEAKPPPLRVAVRLQKTDKGIELLVQDKLVGYLSSADKCLHLVKCTDLIDAGIVENPGNRYIHVKWDNQKVLP